MKDVGWAQMVFVEELNRRGKVVHCFVLVCNESAAFNTLPYLYLI